MHPAVILIPPKYHTHPMQPSFVLLFISLTRLLIAAGHLEGLREPHRRILGHVVGDWRPLAGSLRTASVGSSRVYIPQVFSAVWFVGSIPSLGFLFFRLGPRTLFFVPLFALALLRPVWFSLGVFLHSHDMHVRGARRGGWFSPPPSLRPVGSARHSL